jgi:dihydroxyacetone kinase-like protein
MESFKNSEGKVVVIDLVKIIQDNKDYLSEVDGAIGDGDHGINMNKGFSICKERLDGQEFNLSKSLITLGTVLLTEIGGSMGPLYGSFFRGMGKACKNIEDIDKILFGEMLQASFDKIVAIGGAKVGDKTLIDTLYPALLAFKEAAANDKPFSECLKDMSNAAEKGKDSTVDLVAKIGRAARLGERSRGVLDAGATSCYLLLNSMSLSMIKLLK